jgi:hypothetical protein
MELNTYTDDFAMKVSWVPSPAVARTSILFRVVVRDKKTGEPIENGEGRIFANNADGQSTYDSFVPDKESGTYTGKLRFIVAGEWAVGIQFRRDSLQKKLQRPVSDIRLTVRPDSQ